MTRSLLALLCAAVLAAQDVARDDGEAAELARELTELAEEDVTRALWRIRCVHLYAEERERARTLLGELARHLDDPRLRSAARARASELEQPGAAWPLGEQRIEAEIERRLELESVVSSVRAERLELRLEFHGPVTLLDGTELAWDAARRRPYLRAALRWLQAVRGARGSDSHTLTLHVFSLPFSFGNGFASPLYETLESGSWLPREALLGVNSFLYEEGVQSEPEMRAEVFDNAMHEMGHAFGIGALWNLGRFEGELEAFHPGDLEHDAPDEILRQWGEDSAEHEGLVYRERAAVEAFERVHGAEWGVVPISSDGGHLFALFDEESPRRMSDGRVLPATEAELMSHRDVLSEISPGFLDDLGWEVDYAGATPLQLGVARAGTDPLAPWFALRREVFGVHVLATATTAPEKVAHAAAVLAEYLDNDEDGQPDEPRVLAALLAREATLVMFATEEEAARVFGELPWERLEGRALQDLYGAETRPGGAARGEFDATLEEVLHLVTHGGWAAAYPDEFGEAPGSRLAGLMDVARGGHFEGVPARYPDGAWYSYDDATCEYACQVTEYVYWGLTSLLGGQDFPGRAGEIAHEWRLSTPAEVLAGDPGLVELLRDPRWRMPRVLPDGDYRP